MDLYQDILMDHNRNPRNVGLVKEYAAKAMAFNALCGDEMEISFSLQNGRIAAIKFRGQGCAVSRASASILTTKLSGKTPQDGLSILSGLRAKWEDESLAISTDDKELACLEAVRSYKGRLKCASLAWEALEKAIQSIA